MRTSTAKRRLVKALAEWRKSVREEAQQGMSYRLSAYGYSGPVSFTWYHPWTGEKHKEVVSYDPWRSEVLDAINAIGPKVYVADEVATA